MRFIVFRGLKDFGNKVVDRVYPIANMKYFEYDKAKKTFKICYNDNSWQTINIDDLSNEKMFEYLITNIKDKVVFK
jgi:hypothetical protein